MATQTESSLYTKQMLPVDDELSHHMIHSYFHQHFYMYTYQTRSYYLIIWVNSSFQKNIFLGGFKKEKLTAEVTGKEAEDNAEPHQQLHVVLLNQENAH